VNKISVKDDFSGLHMWYEWITSTYYGKHCTGVQGFERGPGRSTTNSEGRLAKDESYLGGGRGDSSDRQVLECGPVHHIGCRLNQRQLSFDCVLQMQKFPVVIYHTRTAHIQAPF